MGSTFHRQVHVQSNNSIEEVQQLVFRSTDRGNRCDGSLMEGRKQFCKSSLLDVKQNSEENSQGESKCDSDCTLVASAELVSGALQVNYGSSFLVTELQKGHVEKSRGAGTIEEKEMEDLCLEGVW